jgi:hypothetical protein
MQKAHVSIHRILIRNKSNPMAVCNQTQWLCAIKPPTDNDKYWLPCLITSRAATEDNPDGCSFASANHEQANGLIVLRNADLDSTEVP